MKLYSEVLHRQTHDHASPAAINCVPWLRLEAATFHFATAQPAQKSIKVTILLIKPFLSATPLGDSKSCTSFAALQEPIVVSSTTMLMRLNFQFHSGHAEECQEFRPGITAALQALQLSECQGSYRGLLLKQQTSTGSIGFQLTQAEVAN